MFFKSKKEIDDLKKLAVVQEARIARLEKALDELGAVVRLEWRDEYWAWRPRTKEGASDGNHI